MFRVEITKDRYNNHILCVDLFPSFFRSLSLLLTLALFGYYPDFIRALVNYNLYDEFSDNVTTHDNHT